MYGAVPRITPGSVCACVAASSRGRRAARQAEVEHLEDAVAAHHEILGLEVAVHQAGRVRDREAARRLADERDDLRGRAPGLPRPRPHGGPVDVLHGHVERAVLLAQVVDGHDVRMVERGGRARLEQQAFAALGVGGERRGQDLHRHAARQGRILGEVHAPHAALTERLEDAVAAEGRSDHAIASLDEMGPNVRWSVPQTGRPVEPRPSPAAITLAAMGHLTMTRVEAPRAGVAAPSDRAAPRRNVSVDLSRDRWELARRPPPRTDQPGRRASRPGSTMWSHRLNGRSP